MSKKDQRRSLRAASIAQFFYREGKDNFHHRKPEVAREYKRNRRRALRRLNKASILEE